MVSRPVRMLAVSPLVFAAILKVCTPIQVDGNGGLPLDEIVLPPGFDIQLYASDIPNARSMTLSSSGVLFVGTRRQGNVYAVLDEDGDFRADEVVVIDEGLNMPNGVALRDGNLYVMEVNRLLRYDHIEDHLDAPPDPVVVYDRYPTDSHHGWKFIRFGPDGMLYIPVGAPCNICDEEDDRYASITRINHDGNGFEIFSHGVRNTVGFDWHPVTEELWFTDNGRDWMGDDMPPDELNHAPEKGMHFGFPYCHGVGIVDPEFGEGHDCDDTTPPAQELGPHVAALGMRFYTGGMFPENYRNLIFIAEHGSWNRSIPIGYRLMLAELNGNDVVATRFSPRGGCRG